MRCPGSIRLSEGIKEEPSEYAAEGTRAHNLAEDCLRKDTDPTINEKAGIDQEMVEGVQQYLDFVRQFKDPSWIEQKIDLGHLIPDCFGTADFVALAGDQLIIVDLKYGQGLKVYAEGNRQLLIYALGALYWLELLYDIESVKMVIVQPRLDHIDESEILVGDLVDFGETVRAAALACEAEDAPCIPGKKQCQWCRAKAICKARADANFRAALEEFGPLPSGDKLTLNEIGQLLPRLDDIKKWTSDLQAYALGKAVSGEKISGYKLVSGRSNRVWKLDAFQTIETLPEAEKLIEKKITGIGKAEKILGKKHPIFEACCHKPEGKPTLAPASDRRKEIVVKSTADDDFSE